MQSKRRALIKNAAYGTQKMPKNAKRVFKGVLFSIYQWKQKQFDGSYKTFELASKPDVANVIAVTGGKVIMTKERVPGIRLPYLGMPGGRVDDGELPLHAAKRELLEETGYTSKDWILLKTEPPRWKVNSTAYWYVARNCKKTSEQYGDQAGERIEVMLISVDEFLHTITRIWGNMISEFAEIKYDKKKMSAFKKKCLI